MKTYILGNAVIVTVNNNMDVISDGAVAVSGDKILDIGNTSEIKKKYTEYKFIDIGKSLIMPGLVNTHTHLAMSLFRGLAEDLDLYQWLERTYDFRKKFVTPELFKTAIKLSVLELIKSGTTTFCDMSFHQKMIAEIVKGFKVRAVLCDTMMRKYNRKDIFDAIDYFLEKDYGDLIVKALALHAPYTCDRIHFKWLKKMITRHPDIPYSIHLAETNGENNIIKKKFGVRPLELLKEYGLLSDKLLAVHCVWLNDRELDVMKKYEVKVSYNPESNMKLGSGIAPIVKMLRRGITVGLGTDGSASNNDLDLLSEVDSGAKLQKVANLNPKVLTAREMVRMITIDGAKCLGIDSFTGSIEKGKRADLIIIDLQQIRLKPVYEIHSHIVFTANGRDVTDVIVSGKYIVKNKKVLVENESKILNDLNFLNREINRNLRNGK